MSSMIDVLADDVAPVLDGPDAGDADRDVALADAPGAPERVGDHHARGDAGQLVEAVANAPRAGVGVDRQRDDGVFTGDVRGVDAGVGADEAVVGLADQHAADGADQPPRLVEDDLDLPRILVVLGGQMIGQLARGDVGEPDRPALGLRHHLVGDHDDVAVVQPAWRLRCRQCGLDQDGEVIARVQLGDPCDRVGGDHRVATAGCG